MFYKIYILNKIEYTCQLIDCGKGICIYSNNEATCSNLNQWMTLNKDNLTNKSLRDISLPGYIN